jgi:hypothetical protein
MPTWKHEYQHFWILQCDCSRNMMSSGMKYLLRLFESSLEVPVIIKFERHFEMEWYCWELRQIEWERDKQIEWLWDWSFDWRVCMWVRHDLILICYENNFWGRSIGPFVHPSLHPFSRSLFHWSVDGTEDIEMNFDKFDPPQRRISWIRE